MYTFTDDPVRDAEDYQEWIESRREEEYTVPECEWCGLPLDHCKEDYCYLSESKECICLDCLKVMFRAKMEDYMVDHRRVIPKIYSVF